MLILAMALSACAGGRWFGRGAGDSERRGPDLSPAAVADTPSEPQDDVTATEAAVAAQPEDAPPPVVTRDAVSPTAPLSYTVKPGDTLWDIANLFLRDPWLWPEIWQVNPQVQNPHLIYPGDVLALAYGADGSPRIYLQQGGAARLEPRLRSAALDGAIATIPYAAIAAFLGRPTVLAKEQVSKAPRVLAFREGRMIGGTGYEAYVRDLTNRQLGQRYSIFRIGDPIVGPEDGATLGYMGIYAAT
ncbi:MAG: LysM peptidoglycan-binding domain-containing protein, partial [Steroidobacteraceae bacterium]|nr:LysM peptidoglycan-binding domain-containing protein [Steroidobacteraceae bacterium]